MEDKIKRFMMCLIEEAEGIVNKYVDGFKNNTNLDFTEYKDEYKRLQGKMNNKELTSYKRILINNVVENVLFSIMDILDGGEEFNDRYILDIIDLESKKSYMKDIDDISISDEFVDVYGEYFEKLGVLYEES